MVDLQCNEDIIAVKQLHMKLYRLQVFGLYDNIVQFLHQYLRKNYKKAK